MNEAKDLLVAAIAEWTLRGSPIDRHAVPIIDGLEEPIARAILVRKGIEDAHVELRQRLLARVKVHDARHRSLPWDNDIVHARELRSLLAGEFCRHGSMPAICNDCNE